MNNDVFFKLLDSRAVAPYIATDGSAGADLHALCDGTISISPAQTVFVHTGVAVAIPNGFVGLICARSGLATKQGLAPANKVGVIDSDYRGELIVALYNQSKEMRYVSYGDRIAQLVIVPYLTPRFIPADNLDETKRGEGGFGSSGGVTSL